MNTKNLILLHGALGSSGQLQALKDTISRDFMVHSFNFEGHGERASGGEFSMDVFTQNVFDYLSVNQIEHTHLFGFSMGGYVALNFALKYPDNVGSVVTLGTKFDWNLDSAAKEVKMLNPEVIQLKVPSFADHLKNLHGTENWKTVLTKTADMMLELGNGKALKPSDFAKIRQPTLIVLGDLDHMVTLKESEASAKQLPNGRLQIIKEVKHPIEKVNPEMLANLITGFIQNY